jgi:trans-aconitate methyltransferase
MKPYAWDPADYRRHSAPQETWGRELIDKLALRGGERVLDIGSGDGKVTAELSRRVPRGAVVGVDSSPEMVAFARKAFPPEAHPNLRFELADARALAFDAAFDVVFSSATLHWIPDPRSVLASIRRALRPGGRVLLQMGGRGNAAGLVAALVEACGDPRWRAGFERFAFPWIFHDAGEYAQWMTEAGLNPRRVELIPRTMSNPDREAFKGWIRTAVLPYVEHVPEPLRDAFLDATVDAYLRKNPPGPDGTILTAMVRLEAEAEG